MNQHTDSAGTSDPATSDGKQARSATVKGGLFGLAVGIFTSLIAAGIAPSGSGQSAMAMVFLGPAILLLLCLPLVFCPLFGALGAWIRPTILVLPIAILLGVIAVSAAYSRDPIIRRMGPKMLGGVACAVLAGAGVRAMSNGRT
jgi:hypothetical protein